MELKQKRQSRWLIIGLIVLIIAGFVMSFLIWQRIARAPQKATTTSTTKTTPAKVSTFNLPKSNTALPYSIPSNLFASPEGLMVLVNKTTPISTEYIPSSLILPHVPYRTDKSQEEVEVRSELDTPLQEMFAAAKKDNIDLMIGSAYRSAKLQETYFNNYVATDGLAAAEKYSAHPGTSEHQTGLAVDLTTADRKCYLVECFADTDAGKWLAAHAHEYGFILRYMKDKDNITGYQYEPWHYRYVGNPYASAIYESGLTYEEAYPLLKAHEK